MKLKARRGAVIVILGIMAMALMSISAISIDFSRLWTLRNELQTSADAAAHAGAIQLVPPNNAGVWDSAARAQATKNLAMQGTVTVDSVIPGDWDDISRSFTPNAPHTDAISVTVSRQSTGLIMSMLGVVQPRLKARAIGWADAPVNNAAGCIKPIAIPFTQLMWRLNIERNFPNPDSMYRAFDPVNDMAALQSMLPSERTFSLKIGSGQVYDTLGHMSGNYQAVKLPKYWDVADSAVASPGPDNGANAFNNHMSGGTCHTLAVGDSLETQTGNMVGPTICGAIGNAYCNSASGPGICYTLPGATDNTKPDDNGFGECKDAAGVPPDIKAAFYMCSSGCNGNSRVVVSLLGSFSLTHIYPANSKQGQTPAFDAAEIVGIFKPITDPGSVGPGSTTLVKPIIVR
jgi:hypothetical protein